MKKLFSVVLSLVLFISCVNLPVLAETITEGIIILPDSDNYAHNKLLVTFDKDYSLEFDENIASKFSGIEYKSVTELTSHTTKKFKAYADNITAFIAENRSVAVDPSIDFNKYHRIVCVELSNSGKSSLRSAIKKIKNIDGVINVDLDYKLEFFETTHPNDDEYNSQQVYCELIDLTTLWGNDITGSSNIKVGVLDTGINASHEDLNENVDTSLFQDFSEGSGSGVPGVHSDADGHGTFVAGVIGAEGNNGIGVCGVCWDVTLVSLKLSTIRNGVTCGSLVNAINYASAYNIPVLNLSNGLYNCGEEDINAMRITIEDYNGVIVCAAGNEGQELNNTNYIQYPAVFKTDNMIVVGNSDGDNKAASSNYSYEYVDVFAPGTGIYSTAIDPQTDPLDNLNNEYATKSGTSFAAPIVTGIVALMLSKNPNLSPNEIKKIICATVDEISGLEDYCSSGGRVNAYQAVMHAMSNSHTRRGSAYDGVEDFSCDACGYDSSNHYFSYIPLVGDTMHKALCRRCGELFTEGHYWESLPNDMFKCRKCNKTVSGNSAPGIMIVPPPENELYGSSNENE